MNHLRALANFTINTPSDSIPAAALEGKQRFLNVYNGEGHNRVEELSHLSIQYTLAAALADGKVSLAHFKNAAVLRQHLQDLATRVKPEPVAGVASLSQQCALTVRLINRQSFSAQREDAEGRNADDFKPYLEPKFIDCV